MKTVLLHVCCAPCFVGVIERLKKEYIVYVSFYNPNIQPIDEYALRQQELKRLLRDCPEYQDIVFIDTGFEPDVWNEAVSGYESEPEGGKRCAVCFEERLKKTAHLARAQNIDCFTTTLSVSPLKNVETINKIGKSLESTLHIPFLAADFKKQDGFRESCSLSKKYNLYRQNYCGCLFSKR